MLEESEEWGVVFLIGLFAALTVVLYLVFLSYLVLQVVRKSLQDDTVWFIFKLWLMFIPLPFAGNLFLLVF